MASRQFRDRIQGAADFLATSTAQAARGYLDPPLETALRVLACFADGKPHDYEEIAEAVGLHQNTVRQVINALVDGGYPISFTYAQAKANTGRKPVAIYTTASKGKRSRKRSKSSEPSNNIKE